MRTIVSVLSEIKAGLDACSYFSVCMNVVEPQPSFFCAEEINKIKIELQRVPGKDNDKCRVPMPSNNSSI